MKEILDKITGDVLPAGPDFNGFKNESQNAIISGSITLDQADVNQLGKSIVNYVGNADYYVCTGTANTYTLSRVGTFKEPTGYFIGMRIRFRPNIANTGASTVNLTGLGVKNLKKTNGSSDFASGELSISYDYEFVYNGTSFSLKSIGLLESENISINTAITTPKVNTDFIQTKTGATDLVIKNQGGDTVLTLTNGKIVTASTSMITPILNTDFIQTKTTATDLVLKNQAGTPITTFKNDLSAVFGGNLEALTLGKKIGAWKADLGGAGASGENLDFNIQGDGLLFIKARRGGATQHSDRIYLVSYDSSAGTLDVLDFKSGDAVFYTVAYQANVSADTNTYRLTTSNTYDDGFIRFIRLG